MASYGLRCLWAAGYVLLYSMTTSCDAADEDLADALGFHQVWLPMCTSADGQFLSTAEKRLELCSDWVRRNTPLQRSNALGRSVSSFTYGDDDRLLEVSSAGGTESGAAVVTSMQYDDAGLLSGWTRAAYTERDAEQAVPEEVVTLRRDDRGRVAGVMSSPDDDVESLLEYDDQDRLIHLADRNQMNFWDRTFRYENERLVESVVVIGHDLYGTQGHSVTWDFADEKVDRAEVIAADNSFVVAYQLVWDGPHVVERHEQDSRGFDVRNHYTYEDGRLVEERAELSTGALLYFARSEYDEARRLRTYTWLGYERPQIQVPPE